MSDSERQYVHELFPKIRGVVNNMRALAEQLADKRTTLESRLKSRTGLLSIVEQRALADAIGFKITWPEWRDLEATIETKPGDRRDTAEQFHARFRRGADSLAVRAGKSEGVAKPFADFHLETAGRFHPRDDEPIPFFYDVVCSPHEAAPGLFVGLAAFDVRIDLPMEGGIWRHNGAMPPRAEFQISHGDEKHDPLYRFSANRPPMRFHVNEIAHALGAYEGAKPGNVLEVEMRAGYDQCVVEREDVAPLGVKREKVQNHLAKWYLLGAPSEGEDDIILISQSLVIVKLA